MLVARFAVPQEVPLPTSMPIGAGNKPWHRQYNRFVTPQPAQVDAGADGEIEFN